MTQNCPFFSLSLSVLYIRIAYAAVRQNKRHIDSIESRPLSFSLSALLASAIGNCVNIPVKCYTNTI